MSDNGKQEKPNSIISKIKESMISLNPEILLRNESSPSFLESFRTSKKLENVKKIKEEEYNVKNYLIKQTIGEETFGKVKLGIYLPTGDKVTIKILEKNLLGIEDKIFILRKFDILVKLMHRNVILIKEIFETYDNYYIVMEYCEGGNLFDYLVKNRRLFNDEAAFFYYQLINGLEYIHSLGIVHGDLKPENILLTKEHIIKINDFGLSYKEGENEFFPIRCGTPCYASPELLRRGKYNGFKNDIWSTGIILYAMLCGYLPFEDNDKDNLLKKIMECNIYFPNYIQKEAKDLIKKILVIDPKKRIDIKNIKSHPFYLEGKEIFENKFIFDGNYDYEKPLNDIGKLIDNNKENKREKNSFFSIKKNDKNKENIKDNKENNEIRKNNSEEECKQIKTKNYLTIENKENNKNFIEKIFNNLDGDNKKKEEMGTSKKKNINKNNNSKEKKSQNDINRKNYYKKNKELLFKFDNNEEIKELLEIKLNIRKIPHENKINKIQNKIIKYNKFKDLLTKRTFINISQKINRFFNNNNRIKIKLNYNKKNISLTELLNKRQLLNNNNSIDIPNKMKICTNFQKITTKNKKKMKKRNDKKSESFEAYNNKYIPKTFNNVLNLKQSKVGEEIYNYKYNKERNLRNKNNIKEYININKLKKSKLEQKDNLKISKREDITKSISRIETKKMYYAKIDINANNNSTNRRNLEKELNKNNNSEKTLNDKNKVKYYSKNRVDIKKNKIVKKNFGKINKLILDKIIENNKNKIIEDMTNKIEYNYITNANNINNNERLKNHKRIKKTIINTEEKYKNNKKFIKNRLSRIQLTNKKYHFNNTENAIKKKIGEKKYVINIKNKIIIINNKLNLINDKKIIHKNIKKNITQKNSSSILNYIKKQNKNIINRQININEISKNSNHFYKTFLSESTNIEKSKSSNLSINNNSNKKNHLINKNDKKPKYISKNKLKNNIDSTNKAINYNILIKKAILAINKKRILKNNNIIKTTFSNYNSSDCLRNYFSFFSKKGSINNKNSKTKIEKNNSNIII